MSDQPLSFACSACGRQFGWKPEIAGKRARCKCGQVLQAPLEPPQPELPLELEQPLEPQAAANPCPSCGAELAEGSILCIQCGYNMQAGALMGTELAEEPAEAPAAAAPARVATQEYVPPVPMPRRRPNQQQTQESNPLKMILICGVLVAALIGGIVGAKAYLKGSREPSKPLLGQDARAIAMLKDDSPVEARQYLGMHESYMLGVRWTRKQAEYKIDEWYRMGAKKVWAFTGVVSRHVVLELQADPAKRKELFDWAKRWDEEHSRVPQMDVGQDYLVIDLM